MPILDWIETHQTTVDLLKWAALIVAAWVSGLFAFLARYRRKAILEIAETASFVFVEQFDELEGEKHVMRAAFVINASVVNASNEKIVVDHFCRTRRRTAVDRTSRRCCALATLLARESAWARA